jgi:hypothetical protein
MFFPAIGDFAGVFHLAKSLFLLERVSELDNRIRPFDKWSVTVDYFLVSIMAIIDTGLL